MWTHLKGEKLIYPKFQEKKNCFVYVLYAAYGHARLSYLGFKAKRPSYASPGYLCLIVKGCHPPMHSIQIVNQRSCNVGCRILGTQFLLALGYTSLFVCPGCSIGSSFTLLLAASLVGERVLRERNDVTISAQPMARLSFSY